MRALLAITFVAVCAFGQTRGTNLRLVVSPACALANVVTTSSSSTDGSVSVVSGITRFTYLLRTSKSDGAAELRVQFSPAPLGPDVALTYTTTLTGAGTPQSLNNIHPAEPVLAATFGRNAHTTKAGDSGAIEWTWRAPLSAPPVSPTLSVTCR